MRALVNIDVPDLTEAEEFYTAAFGFEVKRRLGQNASECRGAGLDVYLLQNAEGSATAGDTRRYSRHWTPVHVDLVVEDLPPALERALVAGARLQGDVREAAWGRIATVADPFGHGWCLLQFLGRGYDELA